MFDFITENDKIHQFAFLPQSEVIFSSEVRKMCEMNSCGKFNKTWACPPHVGSVETCKKKTEKFKNALMFSTLHKIEDSFDFEGMMEAKKNHEKISEEVIEKFEKLNVSFLALTGEGCDKCDKCAFPNDCVNPGGMRPSVESFGIFIFEQAKKANVNYINGPNTVTYFSMIFY